MAVSAKRAFLLPAVVFTATGFARALLYWHFFRRRNLPQPPDGAATQRRWRHYFLGTTYLRLLFTLLGARPAGWKNLVQFAQLSTLAAHFDELTDTTNKNAPFPPNDNPEDFARRTDRSNLALHLLQGIRAELPPDRLPGFEACMRQVFRLETTAYQRRAPRLTHVELQGLTREKGGCSVLLFRRLLSPPPADAQQSTLLELGGMIQLSDDIFDLWFDNRDNISTLATHYAAKNDLAGLVGCFEQQRYKTAVALQNLPVSPVRKKLALEILHFLTALTRVCLRHYQRLQKKHGTLPLDNRCAMVVDMDRWQFRRCVATSIWRESPFLKVQEHSTDD